MTDPIEHGGNLDMAISSYGGARENWCDLSTGINPLAYPFTAPSADSLTRLPDRHDIDRLEKAAASYYQPGDASDILAVAGAQTGLSLLAPFLAEKLAQERSATPAVAILSPTYNEYARCFARAGMAVSEVKDIDALYGAELAVICAPNNPTGTQIGTDALAEIARHADMVLLDESFADVADTPLYCAETLPAENIICLKSFGKFFGLAGVRLGFVISTPDYISALRDAAGPWPVSGMAIEIATQAFADSRWHKDICVRLRQLSQEMDEMAISAGLSVAGGTPLFRLYHCADARALQHHLAQHHIWTRCFSYAPEWIRLGIMPPDHMPRLASAFASWPD